MVYIQKPAGNSFLQFLLTYFYTYVRQGSEISSNPLVRVLFLLSHTYLLFPNGFILFFELSFVHISSFLKNDLTTRAEVDRNWLSSNTLAYVFNQGHL
jgi:hypothetical protein